MSLRSWLVAMILIAATGWWFSPLSPRVPERASIAPGATVSCPPPPRVTKDAVPLQSPVPTSLAPFKLRAATLRPLAGLSIEARVLSREDYNHGREAELSPTDLALGWQRMTNDAVLSRLHISQSARWYRYRWQGDPPLPLEEIVRSSANMHLIPADAAAAATLRRVRTGDRVHIDGWLVEAEAPDGWHWRSSLSREDSGAHACELIYVCAITRE